LITLGADAPSLLRSPTSISGLWERFTAVRAKSAFTKRVTFDWFSVVLASLFAIGSVKLIEEGYLRRVDVSR
jgi:hypothetical protein